MYVCRDLVHLDSSGPPGVSSRLLARWGPHNRVPHPCSVRVCVRIYTHTPIYTPTRVKNREDTYNTPILPSVKSKPPRQATRLAEPHHPRCSTLNEQTAHKWAHMRTLQRACTQMCTLTSQHLFNVHTCTCMVLISYMRQHIKACAFLVLGSIPWNFCPLVAYLQVWRAVSLFPGNCPVWRSRVVFPRAGSSWFWEAWNRHSYSFTPRTLACAAPRYWATRYNGSRVGLTSSRTYIAYAVPFMTTLNGLDTFWARDSNFFN